MTRKILLHLLDTKFNDPMQLIGTSRAQRAAGSSYTRSYERTCDPAPDTLFMRATELDMGVFAEDYPTGQLRLIDPGHARPGLEAALGSDVARTINALVESASNTVTSEEVSSALSTGMWKAESTKQRSAVLQAAGFARCLLEAIRVADPDQRAVVWEYTKSSPTIVCE